MLSPGANVLILDTPTNHLGLSRSSVQQHAHLFQGECALLRSHDHEFIRTVANRVIELTPGGIIDRIINYDDYITDPKVAELREKYYNA